MAGIFSPTLQSEVSPIQATEQPSAAASVFGLIGEGVKEFGRSRDEAARAEKAAQPSYSERNDAFNREQLGSYTTELGDIQARYESGAISESAYNANITLLNTTYSSRGVGVSGADFDLARESITGRPSAQVGFSDDEILLNNLRASPEGQADLGFAAQSLIDRGIQPTTEAVAAEVNSRNIRKITIEDRKVTDQESWSRALPVFLDQAAMFQEDTQTAFNALSNAGQFITGDMIQQRYLEFDTLKRELNARIPANITTEDRATYDASLKRIDDTFKSLGMTMADGSFELRSQDELQLRDKAKLAVKALNTSPEMSDHILAAGIIAADYQLAPEQVDLLDQSFDRLSKSGILASDIPNSDIIVSNSLMASYSNLVEAQINGTLGDLDKADVGAVSLLNPEEQARWGNMTNADGWTGTKAFSAASKGFSPEVIRSGKMTDGLFTTLAGLALSFESIDVGEEPISFNGVRSEVSANLPNLVKVAKEIDPSKGNAIQAMLYRSLGGQQAQYDLRIKTDESGMNITFDTAKRTYNVNPNTSDPKKLFLFSLINETYGGDISKAYQDRFKSVNWSAFGTEQFTQMGFTSNEFNLDTDKETLALSLFGSNLPNEKDFKTLLDMRQSSTYLSRLASELEPEDASQQREEALAGRVTTEPKSMTADLIQRYESGSGGYDTLFGQAQGSGGPFEGVRVSEKTLGQLYEFSGARGTGSYGAYVKEKNPEGVLATPMGRYQFVGTTLKDVAQRMGLPDDTVFNKETQDSMFLWLARDVISSSNRQAGKRDALRRTWDGFRRASDRDLDQMIAEVESGTPDLGGFAGSTVPSVTTTTLEPAATASAETTAPAMGGTTAAPVEAATVQAEAALPTETEGAATTQAPTGQRTPPEIAALLEVINNRSLTSNESKLLQEYIQSIGS